jgi:RluA family pseudouridine synthase
MEVLFSDRWIVVVNKPAGLLSIQDGYDLSALHVRTLIEPEFGRCWIVHRLDKETSGTLLLARTKDAHRSLNIQFEKRMITKEYRAIASGTPKSDEFEITLPLRVNGDRRHRTIVDLINGKSALTLIKVLYSNPEWSLLSVKPRTGYTHQIRAHLSHIGYPLLGDALYNPNSTKSKPENNSFISRVALHSFSLTFMHPVTNQEVTFTSPYPLDFSALVEPLK